LSTGWRRAVPRSPTTPPSEYLEYTLTSKGLDLKPVLLALTAWGDRWEAPDGPPIRYEHEECGGEVKSRLYCVGCKKEPKLSSVAAKLTKIGLFKLAKRDR
ncbi:MAG: winged helix-turn-helix transcriptional regulator, partial [Bdellovibrionota bacterium]